MKFKFLYSLALFLSLAAISTAQEAEPKLVSISVYPPDIHLETKVDRQAYIVVATREDGVTFDVTKTAQAKLASDAVAKIENFVFLPIADGQTTLEVEHAGLKATATVDVKKAAEDRAISWHLDVMPVFMRGGCNTGSCHGAARGKDGFRLSLFGFDPQGDYYRVTRELGARRINLAVPAESLLMEKSVGAVPHTGGKRFATATPYYATLMKWLEAGAPADAAAPPKVIGLDLYPPQAVMEGEGATQQFIARARYEDGTDRDVTYLASFMSNNESSAAIDANGLLTASARGEAFVLGRYDVQTVGSQVLTFPKGLKYTAPAISGNYIDQLVGAKLQKVRVLPSEVCSDEEFLRRVTIDINGRLPSEQEYTEFMTAADPNKRSKLIDTLLERKEFSEIWAMKWAELLMIKSNQNVSYKSAFLYSSWLTDKISNNVPINVMVKEMLSMSGGTFKNPATNYYQIERDTLKTAENVAQVFMGIRTQCAQCHNHPFDRWTMDDYYSFAAFFSQIGRKQGEDYRETIVFNSGGGEVGHLIGARPMKPKFMGGPEPDLKGRDRREVVAEWLTAPENPYFAVNVSNRVWAHFFGRGIVEPVDDVRVSNPPSNPELLQELGKKFVEYKFDMKQLVRDICNSQAYQRSAVRNESNQADERNFAHSNVRRIPAEQMLDCVSQVTESIDKFRGLPIGARAVQIADGGTSTYFLTTFGRASRDTVCACEAKTEPTLSQALHLINGAAVHNKIQAGGVAKKLLDEFKTPEAVIEHLYIRSLSRKPKPEEMAQLMEVVKKAENPQIGLEDAFWGILNAREFIFNH